MGFSNVYKKGSTDCLQRPQITNKSLVSSPSSCSLSLSIFGLAPWKSKMCIGLQSPFRASFSAQLALRGGLSKTTPWHCFSISPWQHPHWPPPALVCENFWSSVPNSKDLSQSTVWKSLKTPLSASEAELLCSTPDALGTVQASPRDRNLRNPVSFISLQCYAPPEPWYPNPTDFGSLTHLAGPLPFLPLLLP